MVLPAKLPSLRDKLAEQAQKIQDELEKVESKKQVKKLKGKKK